MAVGWRGSYLRYREYFLNIANLYKQRADLRAFLEIILSLSTITIFLLFALKPTALTIISLTQEIREKKQTVAELDKKISDLKIATSVFAQNQAFIPDINAAIGTIANPEVFAKQVQGLASKNGVSIQGMSIGQITLVGKDAGTKKSSETNPLPEGAREMQVSVSVKGDYIALLSFIKDLQNLRLANKVDILGISASTTESGRVIVAVISGRVPFLGQ